MKKVLLSAAIAVLALTGVGAQDKGGFSNGDVFITGSVSFGSTSTGDLKGNTFRFNPSAGLFVSDNISVGVALGIETGKEEDGFSPELKRTALTAGAFGQYYFTPENQFSFLVQLSALYTSGKIEQAGGEAKSDGFIVGFAPGVSYFISDHLALQANIGVLSYQTSKPDFPNAESTDSFNIGLNLTNINFGLTYKF